MRRLSDRVAVITGAASGIGRALAGRFAAEGMRCVLADIDDSALEEAVAELRRSDLAATTGGRVGVCVLIPGLTRTRIFESMRNLPKDVTAPRSANNGSTCCPARTRRSTWPGSSCA